MSPKSFGTGTGGGVGRDADGLMVGGGGGKAGEGKSPGTAAAIAGIAGLGGIAGIAAGGFGRLAGQSVSISPRGVFVKHFLRIITFG